MYNRVNITGYESEYYNKSELYKNGIKFAILRRICTKVFSDTLPSCKWEGNFLLTFLCSFIYVAINLARNVSTLHYSSDPWTVASLEEDSGRGPEITNTFPFYD